jgi:hypothetical protein
MCQTPMIARVEKYSQEIILCAMRLEKHIIHFPSHPTGKLRQCIICGQTETLYHIFYQCSPAKCLQSYTFLTITRILGIHIKMTLKFVLLGLVSTPEKKKFGKTKCLAASAIMGMARLVIANLYYKRLASPSTKFILHLLDEICRQTKRLINEREILNENFSLSILKNVQFVNTGIKMLSLEFWTRQIKRNSKLGRGGFVLRVDERLCDELGMNSNLDDNEDENEISDWFNNDSTTMMTSNPLLHRPPPMINEILTANICNYFSIQDSDAGRIYRGEDLDNENKTNRSEKLRAIIAYDKTTTNKIIYDSTSFESSFYCQIDIGNQKYENKNIYNVPDLMWDL